MPPHAVYFCPTYLPPLSADCYTPKTPSTHRISPLCTRPRGYSVPNAFEELKEHPAVIPVAPMPTHESPRTSSVKKISLGRQLQTMVPAEVRLPSKTPSVKSPRRHSFNAPDSSMMTKDEFFRADKFIPPPAIIQRIEAINVDKLLKTLREFASSDIGWKNIGMKNGVDIDRHKDGPIRGTVIIPAAHHLSPQDVVEWVWNSNPSSYNDLVDVASRYYVHKNQMGQPGVIFYQAYKGIMRFPGRDFHLFATKKELNNDVSLFACTSFNFPEVDDVKGPFQCNFIVRGCVRAEANVGGYEAKRLPDGSIRVRAVWQIDLKASLPGFILNNINNSSLAHLVSLVKCVTSHYENVNAIQEARTKRNIHRR